MVDKPLVSIIMPTYNRAHMIGESIQSVIAQTYPNWELLVIDDGGKDNTKDIIARFNDARIRYIKLSHRGRSESRNGGLNIARGDYITFLDDDDLYMPNKLELQLSYLKDNPEYKAAYSGAVCIGEKGESLNLEYHVSKSGNIYNEVAFYIPAVALLPTFMVEAGIMKQVGYFDTKMYRFEDTDLERRISKLCKIIAIPEALCKVRTHAENHIRSQDPKKLTDAINYYVQKVLREDGDSIEQKERASMLYTHYFSAMILTPRFKAYGLVCLANAIRLSPRASVNRILYYFKNYKPGINFLNRSSIVSIVPRHPAKLACKSLPQSEMVGIDMNEAEQFNTMEIYSSYADEFKGTFPVLRTSSSLNSTIPCLINSSYMAVDAQVYYALIRHYKPNRIIELGIGQSTLFAAEAVRKNGKGSIEAVDLNRNDVIDKISGIKQITQDITKLPMEMFTSLEAGDILFIDSSHRLEQGNDVQYEYCEILPRLKSGVLVHVHDISLPKPYPNVYAESGLHFNEQYLLQAFLAFNGYFGVLWAGNYMMLKYPEKMMEVFPEIKVMREYYPSSEPSAFWMVVK